MVLDRSSQPPIICSEELVCLARGKPHSSLVIEASRRRYSGGGLFPEHDVRDNGLCGAVIFADNQEDGCKGYQKLRVQPGIQAEQRLHI